MAFGASKALEPFPVRTQACSSLICWSRECLSQELGVWVCLVLTSEWPGLFKSLSAFWLSIPLRF